MHKKISLMLTEYENQIYRDFEMLVNINSFSSNEAGIVQMSNALQKIASEIGVVLEPVYSDQHTRPHLLYGKAQREDFYALMGHFDTVHPPESDFATMWEEEGLLRGPGTNDMKSGLIVAIYALAILQKLFPERELPIKALFNSDEEIGSPDSQALIKTLFSGAKAGFVFEPARIENNSLVTARKGILSLEIEIRGRPAHAGTAPEKGINAITEAARAVLALDALNDDKEGITVACNVIHGGVASNVVADHCLLEVDIRYWLPEQKLALDVAIGKMFDTPTASGATIVYRVLHGRPPLVKTEASEKLYQKYRQTAEALGMVCGEVASGGVSDANFLSHLGIPVLDGVGAVGDHSHTKKEYTIKQSILDRVMIFCLLMAQEIEKG